MSQEEIYNFLKKQKKWTFVTDIARNCKINRHCALRCLNQLLKYGEVIRKEVKVLNNWKSQWKAK
jgi:predicted transcriptional regulator